MVDCQQSTIALGTTPSGCTQRAPTNPEFQSTHPVGGVQILRFSERKVFRYHILTEQAVIDQPEHCSEGLNWHRKLLDWRLGSPSLAPS